MMEPHCPLGHINVMTLQEMFCENSSKIQLLIEECEKIILS